MSSMSDRDLLELIAAQVGTLTTDVSGLKSDISGLKSDVSRIEKTVLKIEHEHGEKLQALFDGHKQNSDQLDRIEKQVNMHEEVILRRVK